MRPAKFPTLTIVWICALAAFKPAIARAEQSAQLEITPRKAFIDQPVKIVLRGATAKTNVIIRARMVDHSGREWESHAQFLTGRHGFLDVGKQAPLSGTYSNADMSGLFWSMSRLDTNKPLEISTNPIPQSIEYEWTAEVNGHSIASTKSERFFVAPGVGRIPIREGSLRGTLFIPPGKRSHPAVIVVGGSEGGLYEADAAFLASKGYVALALAYFAFDDLPKTLENIPLEYFNTALDWLAARKEVRHGQIAVMGGSRGGELALLLGSTFPQIKAVVAISPSGIIWSGMGTNEAGPERPAWTYQGRALPFMSIDDLTSNQQAHLEKIFQTVPYSSTAMFQVFLENPTTIEKAAIPVARINGPVLLISGKDDCLWPSTLMADRVLAELKQAKHPFPDRHLAYDGAGHVFPLPNLPTTVNTIVHPISKTEMTLGGDAPDDAAAAKDAWPRIITFLNRAFRE